MQKTHTHYRDVQPKDLREGDRIMFGGLSSRTIVAVDKNAYGQYVIEFKNRSRPNRRTEILTVHKKTLFHINRPA